MELVASGEPAARHVETYGRPNGGVRRPSPNERMPMRWDRRNEKRQNKANLLAASIVLIVVAL